MTGHASTGHSFHHVSLLVADTARALDFYCGFLGLEVDPERPDLGFPGAWLKLADGQIHLRTKKHNN